MLDRETLLVVGAVIPGLLGMVAMGVGQGLRNGDRALWLWGLAMLVASANQILLLAMASTPSSIVVANACFLAWVIIAVVAVGEASGRRPDARRLIAWAVAAWIVFAVCVWAGELRLGRLLNWPNIVLMLLLALRWALRDRRKRMPVARALLIGGLGLQAAAIAFRTIMVALGDPRSVLLMQYETVANLVFLCAVLIGLVLATLGMLLSALDDVNRRLRFALEVDALTRLSSRHAFLDAARALPPGEPRALLMIDADHFKRINDRFGHAGGDTVLRHLGAVFAAVLPAGSLAARLGGEEFAVLLPPQENANAMHHAEALRAAVAAAPAIHALHDGEVGIDVTVSIGIAVGHGGIDGLLRDADAALYGAKSDGRNRVRLA